MYAEIAKLTCDNHDYWFRKTYTSVWNRKWGKKETCEMKKLITSFKLHHKSFISSRIFVFFDKSFEILPYFLRKWTLAELICRSIEKESNPQCQWSFFNKYLTLKNLKIIRTLFWMLIWCCLIPSLTDNEPNVLFFTESRDVCILTRPPGPLIIQSSSSNRLLTSQSTKQDISWVIFSGECFSDELWSQIWDLLVYNSLCY